ncbi:MAG: ribonuclease HII [Chloroflexi bacterium]|nr:ribonuclease HII [Chloroflexota bacterium]
MTRNSPRPQPNLREERSLQATGHCHVAGVDEAGRGAWAGPVYAGAVVLPLDRPDLSAALAGVRDSKLLRPHQREELLTVILTTAIAVGLGWSESMEIDEIGIVPATRRAMQRAIEALSTPADALLVDHIALPDLALPQRSLPKADLHCLSVAAASIVAKVARDHRMIELDRFYPGYGLAQHKGYGTQAHRTALECLGPTPIHRTSWGPFQNKEAS